MDMSETNGELEYTVCRGICPFSTTFLPSRGLGAESSTVPAQRSFVKMGNLLSAPSSFLDSMRLTALNVPITHSFNKHPGAARLWTPCC